LWNSRLAVGRNATILTDAGGSRAWQVGAISGDAAGNRQVAAPILPRLEVLPSTYLVGGDGVLLRDSGNSFYGVALGTARVADSVAPFVLYRSDVAPLRGGLIAVTAAGTVFRDTTGTGALWRVVDAGQQPPVTFPAPLAAFGYWGSMGIAVGGAGTVRRFDLTTQVRG
jgi:hypothetical protein